MKIPISATHAEARALLEERHVIEYRESMLGVTVQARCDCGWRSPKVVTGWTAGAAKRHLAALVEYALEQRRRYAIYSEACKECDGDGYVDDETACGDPDHCSPWRACPRCHGRGQHWILLDREGSDRRLACGSMSAAIAMLDRWTRQEPTA